MILITLVDILKAPLKPGHQSSLRRQVQKPGLLPLCHPHPFPRALRPQCLGTAAPGQPSGSSSCGQTLVCCCQCQGQGLAILVHAGVRNDTLQATFVASIAQSEAGCKVSSLRLIECTLCFAPYYMAWHGMLPS